MRNFTAGVQVRDVAMAAMRPDGLVFELCGEKLAVLIVLELLRILR